MKSFCTVAAVMIVLAGSLETPLDRSSAAYQTSPPKAAGPVLTTDALDRLLAPIALYPDQLLAQMLVCAENPGKIGALAEWLAGNPSLKGSELQDAATRSGFEPSFVALVVFPDIVNAMAGNLDATTKISQAFAADRSAVFASIQRLRTKARDAGKLKSTPQQDVETRTTSSGQQVIVIEPANPQVVYVPQDGLRSVRNLVYRGRAGRQHRRSRGGRSDWIHGGCRARRCHRQRLLLRAIRVAWRCVHVQRRVGRLVRRARGCA
jgi:Protein of unknown function (DUF3300)